jgi:hypothetical protein
MQIDTTAPETLFLPFWTPPAWTREVKLPPIIVAGAPRTGTSAVAGMLSHLGVFVGYRFHPRDDGNPHGYYEDLDFVHLHALAIEGYITGEQFAGGLQYLVAARQTLGLRWGLKDPRVIGLATAWHLLCPHAWWVFTRRPTAEAVASFRRRNPARGAEHCARVWQAMTRAQEAVKPNLTRTLDLDFAQIMHAPRQVAKDLAAFCELAVDDATLDRAAAHVRTEGMH